ncbi:MAG: hypothetical protein IJ735_00505, partial [Clostridia bacterium]|nr:hypothetical protein [Clostridia bacterium]
MTVSFKGVLGVVCKVLVIALVLTMLVTVAVFAAGCGGIEEDFSAKLYSVDELKIPAHLEQDRLFGLFFYNPDGQTYVRSTESLDKINFDPNKPTAIFIHGMQVNTGWNGFDEIYNPIGWVEAGYNFGVFLWSQVADCKFPSIGKAHIWYGDSTFFYADEQGNRVEETEDVLTYPTAMVFGSYYFDLMNRVGDYKGSSISIIGHSLGANTNIAIGSYFFQLLDQGSITRQYLPDRFVYLDAYMDAFTEEKTIVPWLNAPIGVGGVIQKGVEVAERAHKLGISTEYLKSYEGVSYLCDLSTYGGKKGTCKNYFDRMVYIDMLHNNSGFGNHVNSMEYYLRAMTADKDVVIDWSATETNFPAYYDEETEEYLLDRETALFDGIIGWGPTTPVSVTYARNYYAYQMKALDGDSQISTNIEKPVVAGFVFDDLNDNGVYDDRLQARVSGVTVQLFEGNDKIAEATTDEAGAYRFELSDFAGKTYTVKAV